MPYFLGVDVGGTKTHALIANERGQALGFGETGPGNWERVGYDGLTEALREVTRQATDQAKILYSQITGAGFGIGGYDWPSQRQMHLDAIQPLKLKCPLEIVNDAELGILAGSSQCWGISIVSGTSCNCRGWSKDRKRKGRVVGGASYWSGEAAGGYDIVARAMRAITFQWARRGPSTALSQAFLKKTGAKNLDDLIEGVYLGRYGFDPSFVMLVFQIAEQGDPQALAVMRWAGEQLGQMAYGVIHQLKVEKKTFDVVMIGSIFDGHPLLVESLGVTIHQVAPNAQLIRLKVPPVVGGVLLGMEIAGLDPLLIRKNLLSSAKELIT
jgi:N-acetylglucosamine kinase-like BadF-type ATPase